MIKIRSKIIILIQNLGKSKTILYLRIFLRFFKISRLGRFFPVLNTNYFLYTFHIRVYWLSDVALLNLLNLFLLGLLGFRLLLFNKTNIYWVGSLHSLHIFMSERLKIVLDLFVPIFELPFCRAV
jgi:hypothetical protein